MLLKRIHFSISMGNSLFGQLNKSNGELTIYFCIKCWHESSLGRYCVGSLTHPILTDYQVLQSATCQLSTLTNICGHYTESEVLLINEIRAWDFFDGLIAELICGLIVSKTKAASSWSGPACDLVLTWYNLPRYHAYCGNYFYLSVILIMWSTHT